MQERIFIVKEYYSNQLSPVTVQIRFRSEFKTRKAPDPKTITNLITKFEATGSVADDRTGNVGRPSIL